MLCNYQRSGTCIVYTREYILHYMNLCLHLRISPFMLHSITANFAKTISVSLRSIRFSIPFSSVRKLSILCHLKYNLAAIVNGCSICVSSPNSRTEIQPIAYTSAVPFTAVFFTDNAMDKCHNLCYFNSIDLPFTCTGSLAVTFDGVLGYPSLTAMEQPHTPISRSVYEHVYQTSPRDAFVALFGESVD